MRFIGTFVSFALLIASASAAAAASKSTRSSLSESCGADAQIIQQKTIGTTSKNAAVTMTVKSCPGFAALRKRSSVHSTVHKRQILQESSSCAAIECDTEVTQPTLLDCDELTDALIDADEFFFAPADTLTEFTDGNCLYGYANLDVVEYEVFTPTMGDAISEALTACFDDFGATDSLCISPEVADDDWIIEAVFL